MMVLLWELQILIYVPKNNLRFEEGNYICGTYSKELISAFLYLRRPGM